MKLIFVLSSLFAVGYGVPARYDQRQEGDLNVHANLDNFLVVVAMSNSKNNYLEDIATSVFDLRRAASANLEAVAATRKEDGDNVRAKSKSEEDTDQSQDITKTQKGTEFKEGISHNQPVLEASATEERRSKDLKVDGSKKAKPTTNKKSPIEDKSLPLKMAAPKEQHRAPVKKSEVRHHRSLESIVTALRNLANPHMKSKKEMSLSYDSDKPAKLNVLNISDIPHSPTIHLIGESLEDCGPERVRNSEGLCEFAKTS